MENIKILFISRAYPPTVGGIENQNFELSQWLPKITELKTIANKKGKLFLPIFMPYVLFKSILLMPKYDVLLLGDGVLGIIGWFIKLLYPKKQVLCVTHGLDLTYPNLIYQKFWVGLFIKKLDKLIAVGNETIRVGANLGIAEEKFVFIPNGVDTEKNLGNYSREDLEEYAGQDLSGKKVLLTSGRLAKRKGVAWFIQNVMPRLNRDIIYIVAGDGPDREAITKAINKYNLTGRVIMLGYVTDQVRNMLWNTCDLFIQPNIKIKGDMEGFGLSVIEAGSCSLPVIASKLEGLKDAIIDGKNGFLLDSENSHAFEEKINDLLSDEEKLNSIKKIVRQTVIENFDWKNISKLYLTEIKKVVNQNQ